MSSIILKTSSWNYRTSFNIILNPIQAFYEFVRMERIISLFEGRIWSYYSRYKPLNLIMLLSQKSPKWKFQQNYMNFFKRSTRSKHVLIHQVFLSLIFKLSILQTSFKIHFMLKLRRFPLSTPCISCKLTVQMERESARIHSLRTYHVTCPNTTRKLR